MKTIKRYSKLKDAISSGGDDIKTMLEVMRAYVTSIIHNKDYVRLYYLMDGAIRNRGQLTLISPPCIKDFSNLVRLAREKMVGNNIVNGVILPFEADIINITKKENSVRQYEPTVNLWFTSMDRVKKETLTIDTQKKIIWELLNIIFNTTFGVTIRNYREHNLQRLNNTNFRTALAVKPEKKQK